MAIDTAGSSVDQTTERRDALVHRLFEATLGLFDVYAVYIGERLGLYRALRDGGPATSAGLASRTRTDERYVREWLEQQAATGILEVDDPAAAPEARIFRLPEGHDEVLLDTTSLSYLAPVARLAVGVTRPIDEILEAYRTGGGLAYADYGPDIRDGVADLNRPTYLGLLGSEWLPAVPQLHARLQADPPARVADVGCGSGWSSIAIARAYPKVLVDGLDLDDASIGTARANAEQARLTDRVTFHVRDAADPSLAGRYDLVAAFETLHDMSRPVEALRAMRGLLAGGGSVLIVDERVAETFTGPADEIDRFNYGWSILHCLLAGRAESPSAATGCVMRPTTVRRYALEAGFRDVEILPIEHDFFRFYRLAP